MADGSPSLGIDFGTTKSCMAWFNPKTGQAELIRNAEGEEKTPSVVYFGEGETLVGTPALAMLNAGPDERRRVIASVKRELVSAPTIALPGGRRVKPVAVAAEIIRKLKWDAEGGHFHEPVTRAVVTVPAEFDALERDIVRKAAEQAGFTEVELLEEPVAAALAYERAGLGLGDHILVYDLGGGTFDVAVLARQAQGSFQLALPPEGLRHCGGDLMDRALYDYFDEIAVREQGRPISPDSRVDLAFLRECRAAKERLSGQERTQISGYLHGEDGTAIPFRHAIDRATFESLVGDTYIEPTIALTKRTVDQATAQGMAIDTVVLIGGGSRVPLVQRWLTEVLPVEPRRWQGQDLAVVFGAALGIESPLPAPPPPPPPPIVEPPVTPASPVPRAAESTTAPQHVFEGHQRRAGCLAFSQDGRLLLSGSDDQTVRIWDLRTQQGLHVLNGHRGRVWAIGITLDGQVACSGDEKGDLRFWNTRSGDLLLTARDDSNILFGLDGTLLCHSAQVRRLFTPTGASLSEGLAMLRKTRLLGRGKSFGEISIGGSYWGLPEAKRDHQSLYHNTVLTERDVSGIQANGTFIHATQEARTALSDYPIESRTFPRATMTSVAGETSALVAVAKTNRAIEMNPPPESRRWKRRIERAGPSGFVHCLAVHGGAKLLAFAGTDGAIHLLDLTDGQDVMTLTGHQGAVETLAFSPDGLLLASAGEDKVVRLWSVPTTGGAEQVEGERQRTPPSRQRQRR